MTRLILLFEFEIPHGPLKLLVWADSLEDALEQVRRFVQELEDERDEEFAA